MITHSLDSDPVMTTTSGTHGLTSEMIFSKKHLITAFFCVFQRYLVFSLRVGITSEIGIPSLIISLHQLMGNLIFKHSTCLEIKNSRKLVDACVHIS